MYTQSSRLLWRDIPRRLVKRYQHQTPQTSRKPQSSRTNLEFIRPVQHLLQNGSILVSTSNDILDNLCLEEWFNRHYDFSQSNEFLLILWHNHPAVVVGRHQNIWSEVSVDYCRTSGIDIVRRNSGGGTVYHDLENLNLSFLTSKKQYDRKRNLNLLGQVLQRRFGIATEISPREDLIISGTGEKVSGTASKLTFNNSYHHCTLLVDVNRSALRSSLRKEAIPGFTSNATKSVPSPVLNLRTLNSSLSIDSLVHELSLHLPFLTHCPAPIHLVDPTDSSLFADISNIRSQFTSWSWIYGKSPKFSITTTLQHQYESHQMVITIEKGLLVSITFLSPTFDHLKPALEAILVGTQFEQQPITEAIQRFKRTNRDASNVLLLDTVAVALFNAYKQCL